MTVSLLIRPVIVTASPVTDVLPNGPVLPGLLLPQVPMEHDWDRETFLGQTCRKAGLPMDAWRNGAIVEAFTAEVFGDKH